MPIAKRTRTLCFRSVGSVHLAWHCKPGEPGLEACRAIWQLSTSLDQVAQQLCNTRLRPLTTVPVIDNVQQPDAAITQAPSVWTMLEETDKPESVEWLLDSYLSGERASLKLLLTGEAVPLEQDEAFPPIIRLETFIKVNTQRRSNYVNHPYDILSEDTM